jgi:hypothetical protein
MTYGIKIEDEEGFVLETKRIDSLSDAPVIGQGLQYPASNGSLTTFEVISAEVRVVARPVEDVDEARG